jgi:hypothetical protein
MTHKLNKYEVSLRRRALEETVETEAEFVGRLKELRSSEQTLAVVKRYKIGREDLDGLEKKFEELGLDENLSLLRWFRRVQRDNPDSTVGEIGLRYAAEIGRVDLRKADQIIDQLRSRRKG